jgi:hypothetical protein
MVRTWSRPMARRCREPISCLTAGASTKLNSRLIKLATTHGNVQIIILRCRPRYWFYLLRVSIEKLSSDNDRGMGETSPLFYFRVLQLSQANGLELMSQDFILLTEE